MTDTNGGAVVRMPEMQAESVSGGVHSPARPLHVLFVSPWYPLAEAPFLGAFVREYARAVSRTHRVSVLHLRGPSEEIKSRWHFEQESDESLAEGIPTYRLSAKGLLGGRLQAPVLLWALYRGVRSIEERHGAVDIVHAHVHSCAFAAGLVARLRGIPLVVSEHWTGFPLQLLSRRGRATAKVGFALADRVLPVSSALQRAMQGYGIRGRFEVVPNVVDVELFSPGASHSRAGEPTRLLFVGGLVDRKGLPLLFSVLTELQRRGRELELDVVGSGPEMGRYRDLVRQGGLAEVVRFRGAMTKRDIAELMRETDLLVLPSECETFSVVTAEALVSGLPVLVTRCGGPEEFVGPESGMVVPPRDAEAMTAALEKMLDDLGLYNPREIARLARERFSHERVSATLNTIYQSAVGAE